MGILKFQIVKKVGFICGIVNDALHFTFSGYFNDTKGRV